MKAIFAAMLVVFLVACSSNPYQERYVDYGQVKAERARIPPCNLFYADELMDWATDLDGNASHEGSARVVVDADGRVRCSAKESGSSRFAR